MGRERRNAANQETSTALSCDIAIDMRRAEQPYADPFVSRQHAEAAAIQAYYQSQSSELAIRAPRRKSNRNGRSEGSHLEDARLGRRRSTATRDPSPKSRVQTDSRSFRSSVTGSGPILRKCKSAYTEGSPTPRRTKGPNGRSQLVLSASFERQRPIDTSRESLSTDRVFPDAAIDIHQHYSTIEPTPSRQLSLKKSFTLATLRKLRLHDIRTDKRPQFDRSLPPFNHANDPSLFLLAPSGADDTGRPPKKENQMINRKASDIFRARWKQAFHRRPKLPADIPAQHVEATRPRWEVGHVNKPTTPDENIHFTDWSSAHPPSTGDMDKSLGKSSRSSGRVANTIRSRVTSWTNSTCNEATSSNHGEDCSPINGANSTVRSVDTTKPKKKSSFFGKPIANKLRKTSGLRMAFSSEAQELFSALQSKISQQHIQENNGSVSCSFSRPRAASAAGHTHFHSLQRKRSSIRGGMTTRSRLSIRRVSPDETDFNHGTVNDTNLAVGPSGLPSVAPGQDKISDDHYRDTMTRMQKRWASHFVRPIDIHTVQPLNYGSGRSKDRLVDSQQSLDDDYPRTMLSPSLYSRTTNDTPITSSTPNDHPGGTRITVTNREVRRYSISPSKPPTGTVLKGSNEWRRWLSGQWRDKASDTSLGDSLLLPANGTASPEPCISIGRTSEQSNSSQSTTIHNPTPTKHVRSTVRSQIRPTLSGKHHSSFMNERYPMLDSSRDSSTNRTTATHRHGSQHADNNAGGDTGAMRSDRSLILPKIERKRTLTNDPTVANYDPEDIADSKLGPSPTHIPSSRTSAVDENWPLKSRAKSAFDLRANYKTRMRTEIRPIEISRRLGRENDRPKLDVQVEDDTIRAIKAGPYAGSSVSISRTRRPGTANHNDSCAGLAHDNFGSVVLREAPTVPVFDSLHPSKTLATSNGRPGVCSWSDGETALTCAPKTVLRDSTKRSPAQKMVSDFLEVRAREKSSAFL